MDSQPKPPDDPELKNIIDKLANFVARNGPEFEKMTKHKQMNNPKFNFLYGGEFFNYYQCKVATEQQFIRQRKEKLAQQQAIIQEVITQQSIQSAPWQQQAQQQPHQPPPHQPPPHQPPPHQPPPHQPPPHQPPPHQPPPHQPPPHQPPPHQPPPHQPPPHQPPPHQPPPHQPPPHQPPSHQPPSHQQPPHQPPPPPMPTPQLPQPPPQVGTAPWPPHPQQPPPQMQHPTPPLPHQTALQQQQQQLQLQQQHLQQQIQAEKEKQELLLKEKQQKERQEQEQQIQREREQIQREREQMKAQIKESEDNLQKQHEVYILQQQEQTELAIVSAQDKHVQTLADELDVDVDEFDTRLQAIIESCTKDAISNGKLWIFSTAKTEDHCKVIAKYLLHKIIPEGTPFEAKLHLIYLINDVTHHCVRRGAEKLQLALGQVVGPIFCSTYLSADEDKKKKLEKVLKLWETNKYFESSVMTELKSPETSMAAFHAGQLEAFSEVVAHIRETIAEQLSRLQRQHDEFVDHISSMIRLLDARMAKLATNDKDDGESEKDADEQGSDGADTATTSQSSNVPSAAANIPVMGAAGIAGIIPGAPAQPPGSVTLDPNAMANMFPNFDPSVPPPGFGGMSRVPFQPGMPPPFPPPQPGMPPQMHMLPPPNARGPMPPMPDFSKPPPGFGDFPQDFPPEFNPNMPPPDMEIMPLDPNDPSLMPRVPYFDLPAGLMAPLVKLEDTEYEPLDPEDIRLPPPQPPSKRLLAAVEAFYAPPSREAPRNSEGWEQNGLFEFFKAKQKYSKLKKERFDRDGVPRWVHIPSPIQRDSSSSRSPSPQPEDESQRSKRRYRSRSRSKSRSRSRSKSPVRRRRSLSRSRSRSPPYRRRSISRSPPPRRRNRSPDRPQDRSRSRSRTPPRRRRERSRSPSPDFGVQPFYQTTATTRLSDENKGALLMKKMGWGGQGLGAREQGIVDPVSGGEVREKMDMYRGVGMEINDPFESFRKNKSSSFMTRMKARAKTGK